MLARSITQGLRDRLHRWFSAPAAQPDTGQEAAWLGWDGWVRVSQPGPEHHD